MYGWKTVLPVLLVASLLILPFAATARAETPEDVVDHWAQEQIAEWLQRGWVTGYPDGTFRPDESVTRAEFVVFINEAYDIPPARYDPGFPDVSRDDWHYEYIRGAVEADLIAGHPDDTFGPDDPISRVQAAVIVDRLLQLDEEGDPPAFADGADIPDWAEGAVRRAAEADIITGYQCGRFLPHDLMTRAETVTVLDRGLPPDDPTVTFTVLDAGRNPLEGATVRVNGESAVTGADGTVEMQLLPGDYDYRGEKDGYRPVESGMVLDERDHSAVMVLGREEAYLRDAWASPVYCEADEDVLLGVTLEKDLHPGEEIRIDLSEPAEHGIELEGDVDDLRAAPAGELDLEPALPGEGPILSFEPEESLRAGASVLVIADGEKVQCTDDAAFAESPHQVIFTRTDADEQAIAELQVTEEEVDVVDLQVRPQELVLEAADTEIIEYLAEPADAQITAHSGNLGVIEVKEVGDTFEASAVKPGSTFILLQGTHEDYAAGRAVVHVTVEVGQTEVYPDPASLQLQVGEVATIDYETDPEGAWVTFESDDPSVAEVHEEDGEVTAVAPGAAEIELWALWPGYDVGYAHVPVEVREEEHLVLEDVKPGDGATDVPPDADIEFTFDRAIQLPDAEQISLAPVDETTEDPVNFEVIARDELLILRPAADLSPHTEYRVTVGRDAAAWAEDEDVRPAWEEHAHTFTTGEPGAFFSPAVSAPQRVEAGEEFSVTYAVENTGAESAVQEIAGRQIVGEEIGVQWAQKVGLEPEQVWSETRKYTAVADHYRFELETDDALAEAEVGVLPPEEAVFRPEISAPPEVEPGEEFEITFTVENVGGTEGTGQVEAAMYIDEGLPGEEKEELWSETRSITLGPGEQVSEMTTFDAKLGLPHPEYLIELRTGDAETEQVVTVVFE